MVHIYLFIYLPFFFYPRARHHPCTSAGGMEASPPPDQKKWAHQATLMKGLQSPYFQLQYLAFTACSRKQVLGIN